MFFDCSITRLHFDTGISLSFCSVLVSRMWPNIMFFHPRLLTRNAKQSLVLQPTQTQHINFTRLLFNFLLHVSVVHNDHQVQKYRYKRKYATEEASSVAFVPVFFDLIVVNTYDRNKQYKTEKRTYKFQALFLISGFHRALLQSITFISRLNALNYTKLRC